jgi:hypothetical protein
VQREARACVSLRDERVTQAEILEDFETPRLHGQRTRFACTIERPVDEAETNPEGLELRSERQSGWARPGDEDVEFRCPVAHVPPSGRERLALGA